ncbi:MAG: glycosyltransferase 2 family protein [Actinomycetota bacterium]|nr:glycosyltransferase 2 family protein [Actinomycetota bacterium]
MTLAPVRHGVEPSELSPPGERYYRHPGDAVRLVLWGAAATALVAAVGVGTATSGGATTDLGRAAARVPAAIRELSLALIQVAAVFVPLAVLGPILARRRWRRLGLVLLAAGGGALLLLVLDAALPLHGRLPGAVTSGTWLASTRFPSLAYVAGACAVAMVGKPWLGRSWRRAADMSLAALALVMAVAGSAGVPELALALAAGGVIGTTMLVLFGAPNRRPAPAAVAVALRDAGLPVARLTLERAEGGRADLYTAETVDGRHSFVKVFGRDSRDADVLYRGYRALLLRGASDNWPSASLKHDVEHEAFLLMLAGQTVRCPRVEVLAPLGDGSMALALEHVAGRRLDALSPEEMDGDLLAAVWREVATLHAARLSHGALRAANVLVADGRPVIIDLGAADESAPAHLRNIDRAELLASLAALVGADRALGSARAVLGPAELAAAAPYLQPLALSSATRRQVPKDVLHELRSAITAATGDDELPLARLVRVRPRDVVTLVALMGAFYFLLPQLANVDDSFHALGSANWAFLLVCALMSALTYVAAAVALASGVREHVPLVPTIGAQMASSFVKRITPANIGGMTLNVRFLQKAGAEPTESVTAVGLNSVAGAVVHAVLIAVFFTLAGQGGKDAFALPGGSKLLVVIAVVLALAGAVAATRRGRRLVKRRVIGALRRSLASVALLARSPARLVALFGGSAGVTLAYIGALAAAVAAFHGNLRIATVGAVYLGSSAIAAAAPTPGGLGALEAALVAGLTGVGMGSGEAVAAVLSYRLVTYWLPILPGWISFRVLERRGYI